MNQCTKVHVSDKKKPTFVDHMSKCHPRMEKTQIKRLTWSSFQATVESASWICFPRPYWIADRIVELALSPCKRLTDAVL